jgi:hypothetical protein
MISNYKGGSIWIKECDTAELTGNKFLNSTAMSGGALYAHEVQGVNLTDNIFYGNIATNLT